MKCMNDPETKTIRVVSCMFSIPAGFEHLLD